MLESAKRRTVGILYVGDMGSSLGAILARHGIRVVTTVEGRSESTRRRAAASGLELMDSCRALVRASDLVISLVPPLAALSVAQHYASLAHEAPPGTTYVDANSISPITAAAIAQLIAAHGIGFVDASIHGLASRLGSAATLHLSGPDASAVAELFGPLVRTRVLGDVAGKASALKMAMGGISKGITALFLEMALLAREAGLVEELIDGCEQYYPGLMAGVDRMLPTYPLHAARRASEMQELERTMRSHGLRPRVARGVRRLISRMAELLPADPHAGGDRPSWTVREIIEHVHHRVTSQELQNA